MKKIILTAIFLSSTVFADAKTETPMSAKIDQMHCKSCAKSVEKALLGLPFVKKGSVLVSIKDKSANFTVTSNSPENLDKIKKAISEEGFEAELSTATKN